MVVYVRLREGEPARKFISDLKDLRAVDSLIRAFRRFSSYVRLDENSVEVAFLSPEEIYSSFSTAVSRGTRKGTSVLYSRASPERAKAYLRSLDALVDKDEIVRVIGEVETDKSFVFPEDYVSPLLSYQMGPDRINLKAHKKTLKRMGQGDMAEYFRPAIAASEIMYEEFQEPLVCRVKETLNRKFLNAYSPGSGASYEINFYNLFDRGKDGYQGCIYYGDSCGDSLEEAFERLRKGL